jgi:hypothetical protein
MRKRNSFFVHKKTGACGEKRPPFDRFHSVQHPPAPRRSFHSLMRSSYRFMRLSISLSAALARPQTVFPFLGAIRLLFYALGGAQAAAAATSPHWHRQRKREDSVSHGQNSRYRLLF